MQPGVKPVSVTQIPLITERENEKVVARGTYRASEGTLVVHERGFTGVHEMRACLATYSQLLRFSLRISST